MRRITSAALLTILILPTVALSGCGAQKNTAKNEKPAKPYIAVICKGFQHQFWQSVKAGAMKAAAELKAEVSFEGPEMESQIDKQLEMFRAAIDKTPNAVGFAALNGKSADSELKEAQRKRIPVIAFDSGVDSDIPLTTVSTDNLVAAGVAADKIAEAIGGKGSVAILLHDNYSRTGIERRDGFANRLKERYPDIKLLEPQYGAGDHRRSAEIAKAVIIGNPDLKAYFGANEGSAIGIIAAVKELKKEGRIVVVGYDSGKIQIEAIKNGLMLGAVQQNPVLMGYKTVEAALKAIRGESLPDKIDSGYVWADKTNLDKPEVAGVLYE